jgi:hydrogenase-4 component E
MNLALLAGWIDQLAIALLVVVLFQTMTHRLATAIVVVGLQGALLTAVAVVLALGLGTSETLFGAILTAVVRMVLVPLFLWAALQRIHVRVEGEPVLGARVMLVAAIGLTLVAYVVAGAYPLPGPIASRHALPIGLALMLIGMFLMITRRKALFQVIALVTIENGIALTALVATAGMPLAVELGLAFDLLIGVALMGVFAGRISQTFQSSNVDHLRQLKG